MALPGTLFVQHTVIPGYTMTKILEEARFYQRCIVIGMDGASYHCYNFNTAAVKKANKWNELIQEIETIRQLSHPNIVRVIDFLYDDIRMYLITEFFSFMSLEGFLSYNVPNEHQCHIIISGIINGLLELHSHQIHHGDLTPANIFLGNKMSPKICNFAFLSQYYQKPEKHFSNYNINFISPERIQLDLSHPLQGDIWSFGVIIYLLYVKDMPFTQINEIKLIASMVSCQYNPPSITNDIIKRLIGAILVPIPEDRPTIEQIKDLYFSNVSVHLLAHGRSVRASSSQVLPVFRSLKAIEDLAKTGKVPFRRNTSNDGHIAEPPLKRPNILKPVKSFVGFLPK